MAIYRQCGCEGKPKWAMKHERCPKCGDSLQSNKHYYIEWYEGGKRKQKACNGLTLRQCKKLLGQIRSKDKESKKRATLLTDAISKYLDRIKVDSPSYLKHANLYMKRLVEFLGNPACEDVAPAQIQDWKIWLRGKGLSESTTNKHLATVKSMWNYVVPELIGVWSSVKLYRPHNELIRFLSEEQERALLECSKENNPTLQEMIIVSLLTGLRKANVMNLKRSEIDWESGHAHVVQKGGITHTVPLHPAVLSILENCPFNGTDYFWISPHTGRPYRDMGKVFKQCLKQSGVNPELFRWHDLRHTAACKLLRTNAGLKAVQQFLGHADIQNTMRYTHLENGYLSSKVNEISLAI
jgi:site-specific recombinase XerD